ncbi:MAG: tRNA (N6-threonylcarbamoyladenosine(37)-N6)-methyltransferase TrmO [Roseinatronobacter sp.]
MKDRFSLRSGEARLETALEYHEKVTFIGHIESPWELGHCPKNLRQARDTSHVAVLQLSEQFRGGVEGIEAGDALILLYWMSEAPRDLIRQAPRHRDTGTGTFNLRSPARPNPIGLGVVRVLEIDVEAGRIRIDAIDAINGTPLLDIKPYMPGADIPPD